MFPSFEILRSEKILVAINSFDNFDFFSLFTSSTIDLNHLDFLRDKDKRRDSLMGIY